MEHPQNKGDTTRAEIVRVRVSLTEKEQLKKRAKDAKMNNVSDWIRMQAIDADIVRTPSPDQEVLYKLLAELGKQGSNLNQAARALWRRQDTIDYNVPIKSLMHVAEEIKKLSAQLRTILARNGSN